jgi:uncharacterized membrane protein (Fun14 family)
MNYNLLIKIGIYVILGFAAFYLIRSVFKFVIMIVAGVVIVAVVALVVMFFIPDEYLPDKLIALRNRIKRK